MDYTQLNKRSIVLHFQIQNPDHLRLFRFFDIGKDIRYFDESSNKNDLRKSAERSYLPANDMFLDLINKYGDKLKLVFSMSGVMAERIANYTPEVIDGLRELQKTGAVEFVTQPYSNTLASLVAPYEFSEQIKLGQNLIETLFEASPKIFFNSNLIYSDTIGSTVADHGYEAMVTEGAKHILGWKSPGFIYTNAINPRLKLLLRSPNLSDDISMRFSDTSWSEWPLISEKYCDWIFEALRKESFVYLFMNYGVIGEHNRYESGIFQFIRNFVRIIVERSEEIEFNTASQILDKYQVTAPLNVPYPISGFEEERDTGAWMSNELQKEALDKLYEHKEVILKSGDKSLISDFRRLQESDHFNKMSTKSFKHGNPYDYFINYMNILSDFLIRVKKYN